MQARHRFTGGVAKLSCDAGVRLGERVQARARVACDDRTVDSRLNREVVLAARAKAENIAGKEQVDDLPPSVCPRRKSPRYTGYDPVPIVDWAVVSVDFLAARALYSCGERFQAFQ